MVSRVDNWIRIPDLQDGDLTRWDAVQVRDYGTHGIAMRDDKHTSARHDNRTDFTFEEVHYAPEGDVKALGRRKHLRGHIAVYGLEARMAYVAVVKRRRHCIGCVTPGPDLCSAVSRFGFQLRDPFEYAVMSLVKTPCFRHGNVRKVHFPKHYFRSHHSARQDGRKTDIKANA